MSSHASTRPAADGGELAEIGRLLIGLYHEAIDGLHDAAAAAERNQVLERLDATVRSSEAICRLHLGLDLDNGGVIAANLDQLYRFIQSKMPMVNLHNDAVLARRLAGLLEPLLESWTEVFDSAAAGPEAVALPAPVATEQAAPQAQPASAP